MCLIPLNSGVLWSGSVDTGACKAGALSLVLVLQNYRSESQECQPLVLSVPKTLRFENAETLRFLFHGPKNR